MSFAKSTKKYLLKRIPGSLVVVFLLYHVLYHPFRLWMIVNTLGSTSSSLYETIKSEGTVLRDHDGDYVTHDSNITMAAKDDAPHSLLDGSTADTNKTGRGRRSIKNVSFPTERDVGAWNGSSSNNTNASIEEGRKEVTRCLEHVPGWIHTHSDVILVMDIARTDRFGSLMGRVFKLSLLAHSMGYNFCVYSKSGQKFREELGIPTCSGKQEGINCSHFQFSEVNFSAPLKPGYYHYKERGNHENELKMFEHSELFRNGARSKQFRDFWRRNILSAPTRGIFANSITANQNLFLNKNRTMVAVHIRRGDKTWQLRKDVFVKDAVFIQIIQQLKNMINTRVVDRLDPPEIHLFSEDYGTVNWTSFHGIVDEFHLAPQMNGKDMDWELNIRDWVHFIKADITVTSNTFSYYPSHFKDDADPKTGLPINIHPCQIGGRYGGCDAMSAFEAGILAKYTRWTSADPNANDTVVSLFNLPSAWEVVDNKQSGKMADEHNGPTSFKILAYMESEQEHSYIEMIHKFPPVPQNQTYVISYGIYGDNPKYISGAISNMQLAPTYFPGWEMRFYYDESVPAESIKKLKDMGANLILRPEILKDGKSMGMFWRFLVADDETVDRFIIRDADSRLNARERFAVEEWIHSNKSMHMVRDHPNHFAALNGGLWGGTKGFLNGTLMMDIVKEYIYEKGSSAIDYGNDVDFLLKKILPIVSFDDIMNHDAYFCWKYGGNGFPTKRDANWQHVGQVFSENDQPVLKHTRKLKKPNPELCRRNIEWIYG